MNMVGALVALQQLLGTIEACVRVVIGRKGLVPQDVPILALMVVNRSMSGSLLADRLGRSRQNMQISLARLRRRGFVESWEDDSGRVAGWTISNDGLVKWKHLEKELARLETRAFSSLEQAKEMVTYFDSLAQRIIRATNHSSGRDEEPFRELKDQVRKSIDLDAVQLEPDVAASAAIDANDFQF